LNDLVKDRTFYLLARSQKNTRMLRCTMHTSEEIPFPEGVHTNMEAWMNRAEPDHRAIDNAMATGGQGSVRPTALAPKNTEREAKDEYLSHFFRHIDNAVVQMLKPKSEPLVLCAVEYELPVYRGMSACPNLVAEDVRGAPNRLKSGKMHARAIAALHLRYHHAVDAALAEWNHRVGAGASSILKDGSTPLTKAVSSRSSSPTGRRRPASTTKPPTR
jgi:hypothetical protein